MNELFFNILERANRLEMAMGLLGKPLMSVKELLGSHRFCVLNCRSLLDKTLREIFIDEHKSEPGKGIMIGKMIEILGSKKYIPDRLISHAQTINSFGSDEIHANYDVTEAEALTSLNSLCEIMSWFLETKKGTNVENLLQGLSIGTERLSSLQHEKKKSNDASQFRDFKIKFDSSVKEAIKAQNVNKKALLNYLEDFFKRHPNLLLENFDTEVISLVGRSEYLTISKESDYIIVHDYGNFEEAFWLFDNWLELLSLYHRVKNLSYRSSTDRVIFTERVWDQTMFSFRTLARTLEDFYSKSESLKIKIVGYLTNVYRDIDNAEHIYKGGSLTSESFGPVITRLEMALTLLHRIILDYPFSRVVKDNEHFGNTEQKNG